jgi:hypothetical protein
LVSANVVDDMALPHQLVVVARVSLGVKGIFSVQYIFQKKYYKLTKFYSKFILIRKMHIIYQNDPKNKIYLFRLQYCILVCNNFEGNYQTCLSTISQYEFESNLGLK